MSTETSIDARLSDLQRVTEVGFAKVDGKLALFEQRDNAAAVLEEQHRSAIDGLDKRMDTLDQKVARAVGIALGVSATLSGTSVLIAYALSHH